VDAHLVLKKFIEAGKHLRFSLRAVHDEGLLVDARDFDEGDGLVHEFGMRVEVTVQILDPLATEAFEEFFDGAEILLPERDGGVFENIWKCLSPAVFAMMTSNEVSSITRECDVER